MIDVTVKVQQERLAEFYAMYADWLKTAPDDGSAGGRPLAGWSPNDDREASYVWSNLHPKARDLLQILLGSTAPVPGRELAKTLGPDAREDTVFGTFGPPAKLAKEVGRKHMIKSSHDSEGNSYWLEPTVKTLFQKAWTGSTGEDSGGG